MCSLARKYCGTGTSRHRILRASFLCAHLFMAESVSGTDESPLRGIRASSPACIVLSLVAPPTVGAQPVIAQDTNVNATSNATEALIDDCGKIERHVPCDVVLPSPMLGGAGME